MNQLPNLNVPSPILSLCVGANTLWAGGVGGVARYDSQLSAWQPCQSGFPITRVAALLYGDGWLLAGGPQGIARSTDDGAHWQSTIIGGEFTHITCLAASPTLSIILAGTLSGLLLSTDGGLTWNPAANLQDTEIAALAWLADQTVLAATNDGIFRSSDAGLTWQPTDGTSGQSILAITALSANHLLALSDSGGSLTSIDDGLTWQPSTLALPAESEGASVHRTAHGTLLLCTSNGQLYRSTDQGQTWNVAHEVFIFAFAETADHLWVATTEGVLTSADDGLTWQSLPLPPVHDLSRLVMVQDRVYVAGEFTGLAHYDAITNQWELLAETPVPLTLLHAEPDGRLFASTPDGLSSSDDHGASWQVLMRGFLGHVSHLALAPNGFGQAATTTSRYLLRTLNGGQVWQGANSPFGSSAIIGLALNASQPILVTYDPATHLAQLCRSTDQGESWECSSELQVQSPFAATYPDPLLIALDERILRLDASGSWQTTRLESTEPLTVRKFVGLGAQIVALTTHGLFMSSDSGQTWQPLATDALEPDQLLDVAVADNQVYVLTNASVRSVPLP